MIYEMDELAPIVGKMAEAYVGLDSTSITYEKAEQLMEAVIYCVEEFEMADGQNDSEITVITGDKLPATEAYESGKKLVQRKVSLTLDIYNELITKFKDYDNICLKDTFVKGFPEFFKWYDIRFNPQNTILTLDYPILKDLSKLKGIDRIYEYCRCIELEQLFLGKLPENYVKKILQKNNYMYKEMIENLCEIVLGEIIIYIMIGKPIEQLDATKEDYQRLCDNVSGIEKNVINGKLRNITNQFVKDYYGGNQLLVNYLYLAVDNVSTRIKIMSDYKS